MFIIFVIGIITGIFGAKIAKKKGRDSTLWFIICFISNSINWIVFLPRK